MQKENLTDHNVQKGFLRESLMDCDITELRQKYYCSVNKLRAFSTKMDELKKENDYYKYTTVSRQSYEELQLKYQGFEEKFNDYICTSEARYQNLCREKDEVINTKEDEINALKVEREISNFDSEDGNEAKSRRLSKKKNQMQDEAIYDKLKMEMKMALEKLKFEQVCVVCKPVGIHIQPEINNLQIDIDGVPFELYNNLNNLTVVPNDRQEIQISQEIEQIIGGLTANVVQPGQYEDDVSDVDSDIVFGYLDEMVGLTSILSPMPVDLPCTSSIETQTIFTEYKTSSTQVCVSLTDAEIQTATEVQFASIQIQTDVISSETRETDSQTDKIRSCNMETQTDIIDGINNLVSSEETSQEVDVNIQINKSRIFEDPSVESSDIFSHTSKCYQTDIMDIQTPKIELLTVETQTDAEQLENNKKAELIDVEIQTDLHQALENAVEMNSVKSVHGINQSLETHLKVLEIEHYSTETQTDIHYANNADIDKEFKRTRFMNAKTQTNRPAFSESERQVTTNLMKSEDLFLLIQNSAKSKLSPKSNFDVLSCDESSEKIKLPTFNNELLLRRDNRNLSKRLISMNNIKKKLKSCYNAKLKKSLKLVFTTINSLNHFNKCCSTSNYFSRVFEAAFLPREDITNDLDNDFENFARRKESIKKFESQVKTLDEQASKRKTALIKPFPGNNNIATSIHKQYKDVSCQHDNNLEGFFDGIKCGKQKTIRSPRTSLKFRNKKRMLSKTKSNKTPKFNSIFGSDSDSSSVNEQESTHSNGNKSNTHSDTTYNSDESTICSNMNQSNFDTNRQKRKRKALYSFKSSKRKYTKTQYNKTKNCLSSDSYDTDSNDVKTNVTRCSERLKVKPVIDRSDPKHSKDFKQRRSYLEIFSDTEGSNAPDNELKSLKQLGEPSLSLDKCLENTSTKVQNKTQIGQEVNSTLSVGKSTNIDQFTAHDLLYNNDKKQTSVLGTKTLNQKRQTLGNKTNTTEEHIRVGDNTKVSKDDFAVESSMKGKKRIAHIPKHHQNNVNEVLNKTRKMDKIDLTTKCKKTKANVPQNRSVPKMEVGGLSAAKSYWLRSKVNVEYISDVKDETTVELEKREINDVQTPNASNPPPSATCSVTLSTNLENKEILDESIDPSENCLQANTFSIYSTSVNNIETSLKEDCKTGATFSSNLDLSNSSSIDSHLNDEIGQSKGNQALMYQADSLIVDDKDTSKEAHLASLPADFESEVFRTTTDISQLETRKSFLPGISVSDLQELENECEPNLLTELFIDTKNTDSRCSPLYTKMPFTSSSLITNGAGNFKINKNTLGLSNSSNEVRTFLNSDRNIKTETIPPSSNIELKNVNSFIKGPKIILDNMVKAPGALMDTDKKFVKLKIAMPFNRTGSTSENQSSTENILIKEPITLTPTKVPVASMDTDKKFVKLKIATPFSRTGSTSANQSSTDNILIKEPITLIPNKLPQELQYAPIQNIPSSNKICIISDINLQKCYSIIKPFAGAQNDKKHLSTLDSDQPTCNEFDNSAVHQGKIQTVSKPQVKISSLTSNRLELPIKVQEEQPKTLRQDAINTYFDHNYCHFDCPASPPFVHDNLALPVQPLVIPLEKVSKIPSAISLERVSEMPLQSAPKLEMDNTAQLSTTLPNFQAFCLSDLPASPLSVQKQLTLPVQPVKTPAKILEKNKLLKAGTDLQLSTTLPNSQPLKCLPLSVETVPVPLKRCLKVPSVNRQLLEVDTQSPTALPNSQPELSSFVGMEAVPEEKRKLSRALADNLLTILVGFQASYDIELEVAKKFINEDDKTIARTTIDCLLKCIHSKPAGKRKAKGIYTSVAQKKLLGFLLLLKELKGDANFMSTILDNIELHIMQSTSPRYIVCTTEFYVAYCMLYSNIFRVRFFIIKALYKMKNHVLPLLYAIITNWMAVINEYNQDSLDILTRGVVHVIRTRTTLDHSLCDYNVVKLLNQCLRYPMEPEKIDILLLELLCDYFAKPDVCRKYVIIMLCQKMNISNICSTVELAVVKVQSKLGLNEVENVINCLQFILKQFKIHPGITDNLVEICTQFRLIVGKAIK